MNHPKQKSPEALLLLAPGCPHCPTVLLGLGELIKQGLIGRLEVIDITAHPERAEMLGVRTVPWVKIGSFELEGLRSAAELRDWAQRTGSITGVARYFETHFKEGKLNSVIKYIQEHPDAIEALFILVSDKGTELTVRIGISAVMEDFEGTALLKDHIDSLLTLSHHDDPRVRSDACHFLVLSHSPLALERLEVLTRDPVPSVCDIAQDSLEELHEHLNA